MKTQTVLFFLVIFCYTLHAQKNENYYQKIIDTTKNKELKLASLDSLIHDTRNQKDLKKFASRTEQFVDLAIELGRYDDAIESTIRSIYTINVKLNQKERALKLIEKVEKFKEKTNDSYLIGGIYLKKAGVYSSTKNKQKAIENFTFAINSYRNIGADSIYKADALQFRAHEYFDAGKFIDAINDYQLAAEYYKRLGDKQYMFYALSGIINVYGINGFDTKTIKEREKLIQNKINQNYTAGIFADYYNQSLNYKKLDSIHLQEESLLKAIEIIDTSKVNSIPPNNILVIKSSTANFYSSNNHLKKAEKYLNEAEKMYKKVGKNSMFAAAFLKAKALYFFKLKQNSNALKTAKKALKIYKKGAIVAGIMETNQLLSKIYDAIGNKENALKSFKNFTKIKDSIFSITKTNAFSYYQTLYETEQKEREITQQKNAINLLAKENEAKQRLLLFGTIGVSLLFLIFYLYRNRLQAIKKAKMQEEYSQKLLLSQEEERKRISKDLHDSLGQSLLLIKNKVSLKEDSKTKELVNNAIEEMRSISRVLHPFQLEEIGISRALENLISQLDDNYKNILIFGDIDEIKGVLNPKKEVNIFRIVQECLSNIIKHANAESAKITLINKEKEIIISIKDNGIGFDFSEKYNDFKSLGLKTIKERVKFLKGTLKIDSIKGEGATFTIQFPKA